MVEDRALRKHRRMSSTPSLTMDMFSMEELEEAASDVLFDDTHLAEFADANPDLAEQMLRAAHSQMLLEVAKARHEQKSDSLFAAVVENAPRYLKQLRMQQRALKELAAHNKDAPIADTTAKMTGGRRRPKRTRD